jgi:hypothetical protein
MEIFVRVNLKDGSGGTQPPEVAGSIVSAAQVEKWYFHPDTSQQTDVAICPLMLNPQWADHHHIPIFEQPWDESWPIKLRSPGLGDEVLSLDYFAATTDCNGTFPSSG